MVMENFRDASKIMPDNKYNFLQNLAACLFYPLIEKRNKSFNQFPFIKPLSIHLIQSTYIKNYIEGKCLFDNLINYFFNQEELILYSNFTKNGSIRKRLIGQIIGKIAVLNVLASCKIKDILPSQIILKKNHLGMPIIELNNVPIDFDIHVSISHKDDLNIAAAGLNRIGIDIERKRHFGPIFIKRIFTEKEIERSIQIFNHIDSNKNGIDKDLAYTCLFSIKESVAKALGYGLRIDFREINIIPSDSDIKVELKRFKDQDFCFNPLIYLKNNYIFTLIEYVG